MFKYYVVILSFIASTMAWSQDLVLPTDFRQHNLTGYNSSLLSSVFSLDRNNPESLALWSRWQWQTVDGDPTTWFVNYTRALNGESTVGAGFFQHNTGTFLQTGGVLNYAFALNLKDNAQIAFGINLLGYSRELADTRFQPNPDINLPMLPETNDFILRLAPSLRFKLDKFSIGIAAENLFDYNFTTKEKESRPTEKVYVGLASYSFPIGSSGKSSLMPTIYLKSIPSFDNQIGIATLFSAPRFWLQAGYNDFYGVSGGLGAIFFKRLSIGGLMEFGTGTDLDDVDPTFEIITAYSFGKKDARRKVVGFEEDENEPELVMEEDMRVQEEEEAKLSEEEKMREELAKAEKLAEENRQREEEERAVANRERVKQDSIAAAEKAILEREKAQARRDSIALAKQQEELAAKKLEEQKRQDSIAAAEKIKEAVVVEEVTPEEGEKYEETTTEDGLEPGFYLIANVFGTKKYFDAFMQDLTNRGLEPKSFFRSLNGYNYVYLERYITIAAARRARDGKFYGRYDGKTWIFRVVAKKD